MNKPVTRDADQDDLLNPFAAAFRTTRMAMVVTDPRRPDNPIIFANRAFYDLTGYGPDEVLNRNCRFLQCEETDRSEIARIRDAIKEGRPVAAEILNAKRDGTRFWNSLVVSPVLDEDGKPAYFFGSQLDVSDRRETERRLREANEVLEGARTRLADEVAERTQALTIALEEKTALLHELDHRVKNNVQLLTALLGLESRETPDPEVRAALRRVRGRLQVLGAVHRNTYVTDGKFDVAAYLRDLSGDYALGDGVTLVLDELPASPVLIPSNKAAAAALLLHELFMEHTSAGERDPTTVTVRVRTDGDVLFVDLEGGAGQAMRRAPFLPVLIARQLKGRVEDVGNEGGSWRVALPIDPEGRA